MLCHVLSIEWKLKLGTNSTAVIDWGDNSANETLSQYIMANATTPFSFTNEHNYTSEGEYKIKLYAFNFFSNQTISKLVYVQEKLSGLNFTTPSTLATNASFHVNVSLDVVSLSAPNVTILFGDGWVVNTNRFESHYSYPKAGLFKMRVIVANKVSVLSSACWVKVQDPIEEFTVDSDVYKIALGDSAHFLFSIAQGTNVSVNASFDNCDLPLLTTLLSGPKHLNSLLTCDFHAVGTCNVLFHAANAVSRANTSAFIISEIAIQGFNVTVECQSQYPSCFQNDLVLFHLNLTNGTHPKFALNMADGTTITLSNKSYVHSFTSNGTFDINITAYNNVSRKSVRRTIEVSKLVPVKGAYLYCNETVGLADLTVCNIGVDQGTAFHCWLHMGDKEHSEERYTYVNLTSPISYNYTSYGVYKVTFDCNNTISSSSVEFITKTVPRNLEISMSHNSPVMVKNVLMLTLRASETGFPSCFVLELGNGDGVLFGSLNCSLDHRDGFKHFPLFSYPLVQYNYTYTIPGPYNITWNGRNDFNNASVHILVQITERPCSTPKVTLQNIANKPHLPTGIFRSNQFIVRSRYHVDCEKATGAILHWKIFRNETDKGFVLQATKETKTSNLIIKSNELGYGIYCIKLTLSLINACGISGTAEGYINIVTSHLIADIQEGSANKRMFSHPVIIDASGSVDPDTSDQSGLEFNWYCYNASDRFQDFNNSEEPLSSLWNVLLEDPLPDGCFSQNGSLAFNSSLIDLPREKMIKNGIYVLKLVLKAGNREASKATVVQITNEIVSHFHIRLVRVEYINILQYQQNCILVWLGYVAKEVSMYRV